MTIEKYLKLYDKYRKGLTELKNLLENVESKSLTNPIIDWHGSFSKSSRTLRCEVCHRERILRRATARLQAAIARIGDTSLQNVLICKYFYGFKNTEIAEHFTYCERHVYRLLKEAKAKLYVELIRLNPKAKKCEKKKVFRKTFNLREEKGA